MKDTKFTKITTLILCALGLFAFAACDDDVDVDDNVRAPSILSN